MAQHASGWQAGSPVWLGGWARADTNAVRLLGEGGRAVRDAGGERRESTAGRDETARACVLSLAGRGERSDGPSGLWYFYRALLRISGSRRMVS